MSVIAQIIIAIGMILGMLLNLALTAAFVVLSLPYKIIRRVQIELLKAKYKQHN